MFLEIRNLFYEKGDWGRLQLEQVSLLPAVVTLAYAADFPESPRVSITKTRVQGQGLIKLVALL